MARRAKGEGTIIRLKSGRYQARYKGKSKNARTKSEALRALLKIKEEAEKKDCRETVSEAVRALFTRRAGNYSEATEKRLKSTIRRHIDGERAVSSITPEEIERHLEDLVKEGYAMSSVKKVRDAWQMIMKEAGREMYINLPRKKERREVHIYSKEELAYFVKEALRENAAGDPVHRYGRGLVLILYTGLRAGELAALEKEDITPEGIRVTKTMVGVDIQDHPKSSAGVRIIPINQEARPLLSCIPLRTAGGRHVDPVHLSKAFEVIRENAGLKKYKGSACHILRDCFASYLYEACGDLLTVSKILGHSSIRVTEKYYVAVTEQKKRAAIEKLSIL